jgi:hypothetical protein
MIYYLENKLNKIHLALAGSVLDPGLVNLWPWPGQFMALAGSHHGRVSY